MNINKIAIASLSMMSASWINPAFALDLYVDSNTQQIYAAPGENRVKLGSFEKKEEIDKLKATLKAEIEAMKAENTELKMSSSAKPAATEIKDIKLGSEKENKALKFIK